MEIIKERWRCTNDTKSQKTKDETDDFLPTQMNIYISRPKTMGSLMIFSRKIFIWLSCWLTTTKKWKRILSLHRLWTSRNLWFHTYFSTTYIREDPGNKDKNGNKLVRKSEIYFRLFPRRFSSNLFPVSLPFFSHMLCGDETRLHSTEIRDLSPPPLSSKKRYDLSARYEGKRSLLAFQPNSGVGGWNPLFLFGRRKNHSANYRAPMTAGIKEGKNCVRFFK